MTLLISLRSELIKLKRTASLKLCLIAAVLIPLLLFIENIDVGPKVPSGLPWIKYFLGGREPISLVFLPLFIILISTLLLQTEYRDKTWKQVLASPQKLIDMFLAKFIILHLLILLFLITYNVWLAIGAAGVELLEPQLYKGGFDTYQFFVVNVQTYFLVLGISAIQFWLSLRFKNFIAPLAIGFVLWFLAPLMIFEFKWLFADKYPYSFSILSILPQGEGNINTYQWYSLVNCLIFLSIAFVEFKYRKFSAV